MASSYSFSATCSGSWCPDMDVSRVKDAYVIKMDLPEMTKAEVDVEVSGSEICISGTRTRRISDEDQKFVALSERGYGRFERCLQLSGVKKNADIKASFDAQVLTVNVSVPEKKTSWLS